MDKHINATPEKDAWRAMKTRCYCKKYHSYNRYGGRGIKVCDEWLNDCQAFLDYIGNKPEPKSKYSLDRIDNNGNYEPGNVKWSTREQQNYNRQLFPSNKTGTVGVCFDVTAGKYMSYISIKGHNKPIGRYKKLEDAIKARKDYELKMDLTC